MGHQCGSWMPALGKIQRICGNVSSHTTQSFMTSHPCVAQHWYSAGGIILAKLRDRNLVKEGKVSHKSNMNADSKGWSCGETPSIREPSGKSDQSMKRDPARDIRLYLKRRTETCESSAWPSRGWQLWRPMYKLLTLLPHLLLT